MLFTAALFTIAKMWKQRKCPPTDEWIKMWGVCVCIYIHTHTMEYHSALTKNEILPSATMWIDLESVTSSEMSDRERQMLHVSLICGI